MYHRLLLGTFPHSERRRPLGRLVVAVALAAVMYPFGGCSNGGSAAGEGTVDLSSAKEASRSNPEISKAAAVRGKAGIGDFQKKTRRR
jgi:hypothetical protein